MDIRDWTIALIEPNKFEAQIEIDLLKAAGTVRIRYFRDNSDARRALELYPANVILLAMDGGEIDGVEWTKQFRRDRRMVNRKASIFVLSHTVTRQIAENCRHGGANAIIGKPLSGASLLSTIKKVLANPRPFIDAEGYVGPCRRAGIVTTGAVTKRRQSDNPTMSLSAAIAALASATGDFVRGRTPGPSACAAALKALNQVAQKDSMAEVAVGCAAYDAAIAAPEPYDDAFKARLTEAMDDLARRVAVALDDGAGREALAQRVREAETRAGKAA